jgi:hypothetical protein
MKWFYIYRRGDLIAKLYGDGEQLRNALRVLQAFDRLRRINVVQASDWCETWELEAWV